MIFLFLTQRQAIYRALKPIQRDTFTGRMYSRTDALRVIRRFEKLNGVEFDPYNKSHTDTVAGKASHEHFFREVRRLRWD